jgi:hypothetical protein
VRPVDSEVDGQFEFLVSPLPTGIAQHGWLRALCNRPRAYASPDVLVADYSSVWLGFVTLAV